MGRFLFVLVVTTNAVGAVVFLLGALFALAGDEKQQIVGIILVAGMTLFLSMSVRGIFEVREILRHEKQEG